MVSEQHVVLPCCIQMAEIVKFWITGQGLCCRSSRVWEPELVDTRPVPACCCIDWTSQQIVSVQYNRNSGLVIYAPVRVVVLSHLEYPSAAPKASTKASLRSSRGACRLSQIQFSLRSMACCITPSRNLSITAMSCFCALASRMVRSQNLSVVLMMRTSLCCDHIFDINHSANSRNGII